MDQAKKLEALFAASDDFSRRVLPCAGGMAVLYSIRELCDKTYLAQMLVRPLLKADLPDFQGDFNLLFPALSVQPWQTAPETARALLDGSAAIVVQNAHGQFRCIVPADSYFGRGVSEPDTDVTVRGPRGGFVENLDKNISLLRRSLRTPALCTEECEVGNVTHTRVCLMWLDGRADPAVTETLRKKLRQASVSGIADSGSLEMLLKNKPFGLFPSFGSTEKITKASSLLLAGRTALLCDGSPFVLTAPFVFAESLQSPDDYTKTPYTATFLRLLRLAALLCALYLPALYLVFSESAPALLAPLLETRADLTVPLCWELFLMLTLFEILREVGQRMPRAVGDAVGFAGSIIIGDAATKAGLASTAAILVVAVSAVANFIVPVYMNINALLRYAFLFLGSLFSLFGLAAGTVLLVCLLCAKNSFGASYLSPLVPWKARGLEDFLLAVPQKTAGRKEEP